jgi:hypothetical protein
MPLPQLEERNPIVLNEADPAIELKDPTDDISDVFKGQPPKKTRLFCVHAFPSIIP